MKIDMNFIAARQEYNTPDNYVPQPYFRRGFEVKKDLVSATLTIGALGWYEVHINGEDITVGEMASYRANPDHFVYFDRYDITDKLTEGKNVLASVLGNGIQNTVVRIWGGLRFPWRSAPALSFTLELNYADGTTETVISDEETLCSDSPILFNDYYFGEYYDARLEQKGWDTVDFDDTTWHKPILRKAPRGEARICESEPIRIDEERKVVSITPYEDGYIYDFGVNGAGLCRLHINGEAGQKIVTKHFEVMVDGKPYYKNLCYNGCERMQEDEYTCAGGEVTHKPRFTYHGFRYVFVKGIKPEQATEDLLTYLVLHSDVAKRGSFWCDNEVINQIQAATVRSDLSNLMHIPTDSPHREKNGWTADAALSAEQMLLNLGPENLFKEWMRSVYRSVNTEGMIPGIIPTSDWGYEEFNGPCWDCVLVYLPYYVYKFRGDKEIIREAVNPLMHYLTYLYGIIRPDDLIEAPGGLGDWAQTGRSSGRAFKTPVIVTDTIISRDIALKSAFIFEELGMKENAEYAHKLADRLYSGIRKNFFDFSTGYVNGDTQTSCALVLYYDLLETEEEKRKVLDYLLNLIINKDKEHFNVGVIGNRVLFRVLCDNGYTDLAFKMVVRTDFPAFGNLIARGATTLWEFHDDEGAKIDSLNHHFWGDISAWFYEYLAGIRINPTVKDINHVDIVPVFPEALNSVKASHELVCGKISVSIDRNDTEGTIEIESPETVHGEIRLPAGWSFDNGESVTALNTGKYNIKKA